MTISLTQAAAKRVHELLGGAGGTPMLRVGVKPSGCSGYSYVIGPAQEITAEDVVCDDQGIRVVVHRDSVAYLEGTEIDFRREGLNAAFRFNNPKAKESCGCGESFAV